MTTSCDKSATSTLPLQNISGSPGAVSDMLPSTKLPAKVDETNFTSDHMAEDPPNYLKGWSLHVVTVALCLSIFLASLEVSIVSTSLLSITDDLQGFSRSSWIVTAYMITYTGFLIIWAKLSDIYGRKFFVLLSVLVFVIFSGACGAAQSMTQLIVFRAFQGFGGAGTYSMVVVIFFELVPPEKFAGYTSLVSGVLAIALLLGPLFGGIINNFTTWRWVFLLNVPAGVAAIAILAIAIPNNFPYHGLPQASHRSQSMRQLFSKELSERVDFLGAFLLLAASILLVTALEEAGTHFAWRSAFIIVLLILSLFLWIAFLAWERKVTRAAGVREPVFPWRFMQSRICIGLILTMFLVGAPFTVAIIQIPLRFQTVNGVSALGAGVRLLPFALASPIGSVLAAGIAGKAKTPPIYFIFLGAILQIVGFSLLSTAPTTTKINPAQYGYQVIAGFGCGVSLASLIVMTPFAIEKHDKSVAMSAMIQFRTMGGAIGLAIVTTALNSYIKSHLAQYLSPDQIASLLETAEAFKYLPPDIINLVKGVFARGYNLQVQIMIGFAVAQIPASFLMWKKNQILV